MWIIFQNETMLHGVSAGISWTCPCSVLADARGLLLCNSAHNSVRPHSCQLCASWILSNVKVRVASQLECRRSKINFSIQQEHHLLPSPTDVELLAACKGLEDSSPLNCSRSQSEHADLASRKQNRNGSNQIWSIRIWPAYPV